MVDLLTDPNAWLSLLTLTVLEIVLGIDNVIFLSLVSSKLPKAQQPSARRIGLFLALIMRILLLLAITWVARLVTPLFEVLGHPISWRDIILIGGGLFLIYKGTAEIHHAMEGHEEDGPGVKKVSFVGAIAQIVALDLVFSLDSVITAIGMASHVEIMIAAVCIAILVMLVAAAPVANFVEAHPTVKMLALSFLMLIGVALVADGLGQHIPREYIYFAIAFSAGVEMLNLYAAKRRAKAHDGEDGEGV